MKRKLPMKLSRKTLMRFSRKLQVRQSLDNKKGASLVSVMVAFLLLMIMLLMFQKSLQLSGNLLARSVDMRKEEQELIGAYYQNRANPTQAASAGCVFSGDSGSFSLNTQWSVYREQNSSIFYFGDGTTGYEQENTADSSNQLNQFTQLNPFNPSDDASTLYAATNQVHGGDDK